MSPNEWTPERIANVRDAINTITASGGRSAWWDCNELLLLLDALETAQASALQPGQVAVDEVLLAKAVELIRDTVDRFEQDASIPERVYQECSAWLARLNLAPAALEPEVTG